MTSTSGPQPAAAGSSFYSAMRILPLAQRDGMYQVYAFCRAVDDIADEGGPRTERKAALNKWRADIERLFSGGGTTDLTHALADPIEKFKLKREDFLAVIDGMEMDARADIVAPDWATLDLYCDRVASAVGRLSVKIFGIEDKPGVELSHHLGRALQLTNILRDLDEDAAIGRLYLPREALRYAGIATEDIAAVLAHPALTTACLTVAERARGHFEKADAIMRAQPRAAVKSPRIMGTVYRAILDEMMRKGWATPRTRIRASKLKLLQAALRHGVF
jgi:presqualene diphosphate synthase